MTQHITVVSYDPDQPSIKLSPISIPDLAKELPAVDFNHLDGYRDAAEEIALQLGSNDISRLDDSELVSLTAILVIGATESLLTISNDLVKIINKLVIFISSSEFHTSSKDPRSSLTNLGVLDIDLGPHNKRLLLKSLATLRSDPGRHYHIVKSLSKGYKNLDKSLKKLCVDWFAYILAREPDAIYKFSGYFDNIGGQHLIFDFCKANHSLASDPNSETHKALVYFCKGFTGTLLKKLEKYLNIEQDLSAEKVLGVDFDVDAERKERIKLSEEYWEDILDDDMNPESDLSPDNTEKLGHCMIFPCNDHEKNIQTLAEKLEVSKLTSKSIHKWGSNWRNASIKSIMKNPVGMRGLQESISSNTLLGSFLEISAKLESMIEEGIEISPLLIFIFCSNHINQKVSPNIQDFLIQSLSYLLLIAPQNLNLLKTRNSRFIWKLWTETYKEEIKNNPNVKKLLLDAWGREEAIPQFLKNIYNPETVKKSKNRVRSKTKKVINPHKKKKAIPLDVDLPPEKKAELDAQRQAEEQEKTFEAPIVKATEDPYTFSVSGLETAQVKNKNIQLLSTKGVLNIDGSGKIDLSEFKNKNHDVTIKLWFGFTDKDEAKYHPRAKITLPKAKRERVLDKTPPDQDPVESKVKQGPVISSKREKPSPKETQQEKLANKISEVLNNSFALCLKNNKVDFVNEKGCVFTLSSEILEEYPECQALETFGYDSESGQLLLEEGESLIPDLEEALELLALEIMDDYELEMEEKEMAKKEQDAIKKEEEKSERAKNSYAETKKLLENFPDLNKANKLFLGSTPDSFKTDKKTWTWHFFPRGGKYEKNRNQLKERLNNQGITMTLNAPQGRGLESITLELEGTKIEVSCDNDRKFHARAEHKNENYNKLFALGRQIFAYMAVKTTDHKKIKTIEEKKRDKSWKTHLIEQLNEGMAQASNGDFYKPSENDKGVAYFMETGDRICAVRSKIITASKDNSNTVPFRPEDYETLREIINDHESFKKYFLQRSIATYLFTQNKSTVKTEFRHPKAQQIIEEIFTRVHPDSGESLESLMINEGHENITPLLLLETLVQHGEVSVSICDYIIDKFEQSQIGIRLQGEVSYSLAELQEFAEREGLPLYMPVD